MEPFEVYKLYLAIKLHFTTKSYDVVKYKGKVRVKQETQRHGFHKEVGSGL